MILLVDDVRTFHVDCTVRNYKTAIDVIRHCSISLMYLDFDFGEDKSGLDILKDAFANLPKRIQLVTMNPVGRKQMEDFLLANDYAQTGSFFSRQ